ncbi:Uncharacterised protein [Bordetella pertussis]|nr:Uncharacterised protein [Bordetella pertussis]
MPTTLPLPAPTSWCSAASRPDRTRDVGRLTRLPVLFARLPGLVSVPGPEHRLRADLERRTGPVGRRSGHPDQPVLSRFRAAADPGRRAARYLGAAARQRRPAGGSRRGHPGLRAVAGPARPDGGAAADRRRRVGLPGRGIPGAGAELPAGPVAPDQRAGDGGGRAGRRAGGLAAVVAAEFLHLARGQYRHGGGHAVRGGAAVVRRAARTRPRPAARQPGRAAARHVRAAAHGALLAAGVAAGGDRRRVLRRAIAVGASLPDRRQYAAGRAGRGAGVAAGLCHDGRQRRAGRHGAARRAHGPGAVWLQRRMPGAVHPDPAADRAARARAAGAAVGGLRRVRFGQYPGVRPAGGRVSARIAGARGRDHQSADLCFHLRVPGHVRLDRRTMAARRRRV